MIIMSKKKDPGEVMWLECEVLSSLRKKRTGLLGFMVYGLGFRVYGLWFMVEGLGFWV